MSQQLGHYVCVSTHTMHSSFNVPANCTVDFDTGSHTVHIQHYVTEKVLLSD